MVKANFVFSGIAVDSIDKANQFYTKILGLELDNNQMGLHFNLAGGGKLFVYERPGHQPAAYTVLNFVVSNIDQVVKELTDKGVSFEMYDNLYEGATQEKSGIMRSPDSAKYGPSIAWFKDPAGNTMSIIQDE